MNPLLKAIKEYLLNNSLEKVKKDWESYRKYEQVGPSIETFIKRSKYPCTHTYYNNVCDWRGVRKYIICGKLEG